MRLNQYIARASGVSRRKADEFIASGRVQVDGHVAHMGEQITNSSLVVIDGKETVLPDLRAIMIHKPVGYVCSREGQGNPTIYTLLPEELHTLKPVGRLDKESSGLLILTNNGSLAQQLTHPSFSKNKIYRVELNKPLSDTHWHKIEQGIKLEDGLSRLRLEGTASKWTVTMSEGRNRQIRRTFHALGYEVVRLHRMQLGPYKLGELTSGKYKEIIVK